MLYPLSYEGNLTSLAATGEPIDISQNLIELFSGKQTHVYYHLAHGLTALLCPFGYRGGIFITDSRRYCRDQADLVLNGFAQILFVCRYSIHTELS